MSGDEASNVDDLESGWNLCTLSGQPRRENINLEDNGILDERPDVCHFLPVFMTKAATNPTFVRRFRTDTEPRTFVEAQVVSTLFGSYVEAMREL